MRDQRPVGGEEEDDKEDERVGEGEEYKGDGINDVHVELAAGHLD